MIGIFGYVTNVVSNKDLILTKNVKMKVTSEQILKAWEKHNKKTHGGKRNGAGRPKLKKSQKKEPTKTIRVPLSKLSAVLKLIGKA